MERINDKNNTNNIIILNFYDELYSPLALLLGEYIENCTFVTMYKNNYNEVINTINQTKNNDLNNFILFVNSSDWYLKEFVNNECVVNHSKTTMDDIVSVYDTGFTIHLHGKFVHMDTFNLKRILSDEIMQNITKEEQLYLDNFIEKLLNKDSLMYKLYSKLDIIQYNMEEEFIKMIKEKKEYFKKEWLKFV